MWYRFILNNFLFQIIKFLFLSYQSFYIKRTNNFVLNWVQIPYNQNHLNYNTIIKILKYNLKHLKNESKQRKN